MHQPIIRPSLIPQHADFKSMTDLNSKQFKVLGVVDPVSVYLDGVWKKPLSVTPSLCGSTQSVLVDVF